MVLRYCLFKDCHNAYDSVNGNYSKQNITFFQFPKDPQRRQKWFQLGKAKENLPLSYYFYCSDHFDRKYISQHNRRTVLVGEAVPYAYASVDNNDIKKEAESTDGNVEVEMEYYITDDEQDNNFLSEIFAQRQEEEYLLVESTTKTEDVENLIQITPDTFDSESEFVQMNETNLLNKFGNKRKAYASMSPSCSNSKAAKSIFTLQPIIDKKSVVSEKTITLSPSAQNDNIQCSSEDLFLQDKQCQSQSMDNECPNNTPDEVLSHQDATDTKVTTFIFKGEEYVQMPKDYYLWEKLNLTMKLEKAENVIENIKKQLAML